MKCSLRSNISSEWCVETDGRPQVDVHVCSDKAEWESIHFFHGYGDLGMIFGLIARNKGLALGSKGLKESVVQYHLQIIISCYRYHTRLNLLSICATI